MPLKIVKMLVRVFGVLAFLFFIIWTFALVLGWMRPLRAEKNFTRAIREKGFVVTGHRGMPWVHAESSLEGFKELYRLDPSAILEVDIYRSADGVAVITHENDLSILTNGSGLLEETPWNILEKLDSGWNISLDNKNTYPFREKGYRFVTLETLFKELPFAYFSLEIKTNDIPFAISIQELVEKYQFQDRVLMASFHLGVMQALRKNWGDSITYGCSSAQVAYFFILQQLGLDSFYFANCDIFIIPQTFDVNQPEALEKNSSWLLATPAFIHAAQRWGYLVTVWTINNESNMQKLLEAGVDSIVTDDAKTLLQLKEKFSP